MSNRQKVLELVSALPEDASFQEFALEVELLAGIERGLAQADRREGITADELKALIQKWA